MKNPHPEMGGESNLQFTIIDGFGYRWIKLFIAYTVPSYKVGSNTSITAPALAVLPEQAHLSDY